MLCGVLCESVCPANDCAITSKFRCVLCMLCVSSDYWVIVMRWFFLRAAYVNENMAHILPQIHRHSILLYEYNRHTDALRTAYSDQNARMPCGNLRVACVRSSCKCVGGQFNGDLCGVQGTLQPDRLCATSAWCCCCCCGVVQWWRRRKTIKHVIIILRRYIPSMFNVARAPEKTRWSPCVSFLSTLGHVNGQRLAAKWH